MVTTNPPAGQVSDRRECKGCGLEFVIDDGDLRFYERVAPEVSGVRYPIDPPLLCPACREQRRLAFRNERQLYRRPSSFSGKLMITTYPPESIYQVYHYDEWWSDSWDASDYGRDFDFERPFFEQYYELWKEVPQVGLITSRNHNSEYTNFSEQEKNCYMVFASNRNQDCMYSSYIWDSRSCVDCFDVEDSELLYDCVSCSKCYNCRSSDLCRDSFDLLYCYDCHGCRNLVACASLRRKEYQVLNRSVSKAEYDALLNNPDELAKIREQYELLKRDTPRLFAQIINCEKVSGSNLRNCSRVRNGFNAFDLQDAHYVENVSGNARDLLDVSGCTNTELGCELISVAYGYRVAFCLYCHTSLSDSYYCVSCMNGKHLFGCNSLRNKEYAILNKVYSREDYFALLPRIIEHMRKHREWGEFFPMQISPWGYNDTAANDYYPLAKEVATERGLSWAPVLKRDYPKPDGLNVIRAEEIPRSAMDVDESFTNKIFLCEVTGKAFRILVPELRFYKNAYAALPRKCPEQRHKERLTRLSPRELWRRQCDNVLDESDARCVNCFETPFSPEGNERVYCEECYRRLHY